jgi:hypothetical protein
MTRVDPERIAPGSCHCDLAAGRGLETKVISMSPPGQEAGELLFSEGR